MHKMSSEPPAKKQKTEAEEQDAEMQAAPEAPKAPEPPKELEENAVTDSSPKIKGNIIFHTADTTMNVMPSSEGSVLMALTDGGIRHLLAGARASVGVKSGRYLFEAKIVERVKREDKGATVTPKHVLRIGLSTAGSSLFLGETADSVCFDAEGFHMHNKVRTPTGKRGGDGIYALLVNIDVGSNANTVSLFKDGVRVSKPQALPEHFKGKVLYPTITFRNYTIQANFGPKPLAPLPFTCTMFQDATEKSAVVTPAPPANEKHEVLFPVLLPGEGAFDWLDLFLSKNPKYTELSDRAILDWCEKSGIKHSHAQTASHDKPSSNTGISDLDDMSVRRTLQSVCGLQNRSYVVMEVKGNLLKEDRALALKKFDSNQFNIVAQVLVAEPDKDFKEKVHALILKQKQEASDKEFQAKKAEEAKKKLIEKRQKELEKAKKKIEKERKRKLDEIEKAKATAKAKAEGKEEEAAEETKEDDAEEEEVQAPEEPEVAEEPPKVKLTDDEKKILFRVTETPDLMPFVLSTSFPRFSFPTKEEGFTEVKFGWAKEKAAETYLKNWILERKLTTRVEELVPGAWFNVQWKKWQSVARQWQDAQKAYKALLIATAQAKSAKAAKKAQAEKVAAVKAELAKKAAEAKKAAKKEGEEDKEEDAAMEQAPAAAEEQKEPEQEEAEEPQVNFDDFDVFSAEDVANIGGGMPLFKEFMFEDWMLINLAFELHLMTHSFKKDINDPDRSNMHVDHISFYYNKYYKKPLTLKNYGVETVQDLVNLVKDTVFITKGNTLDSGLSADMENFQVFVQMTEELRRHRVLMLDVGEESFRLKFIATPQTQSSPQGGKFGAGKGAGANIRPAFAGKGAPIVAVKGAAPITAKGAARPWQPQAVAGVRPTIAKVSLPGKAAGKGFTPPSFGTPRPAGKGNWKGK